MWMGGLVRVVTGIIVHFRSDDVSLLTFSYRQYGTFRKCCFYHMSHRAGHLSGVVPIACLMLRDVIMLILSYVLRYGKCLLLAGYIQPANHVVGLRHAYSFASGPVQFRRCSPEVYACACSSTDSNYIMAGKRMRGEDVLAVMEQMRSDPDDSDGESDSSAGIASDDDVESSEGETIAMMMMLMLTPNQTMTVRQLTTISSGVNGVQQLQTLRNCNLVSTILGFSYMD